LRNTVPDLAPESDEEWLELAKGTYRRCADGKLRFDWDPGLLKPFAAGGAAIDLWPLFRALRNLPVLVVRGERSAVLKEEVFERYTAEIPGVMRVTVPRVGHVPSLNEAVCRDGVDALLARIDAAD